MENLTDLSTSADADSNAVNDSVPLVQYHPRRFREFRYVYPVISRRSAGLSLGVNLSPSARCNFSCVYCQVLAENSETLPNADFVDLNVLESELRTLIGSFYDGSLFQNSYLSVTPPEKRVLKDIAFSGDGEPTLSPQFAEAVHRISVIRKELCDESVKIVLITNGTTLYAAPVQIALRQLLENNGEIWAKLDAGTPKFFKAVSRSSLSYETLMTNLSGFTEKFPVVIQTCFMLLHGQAPNEEEIRRYAEQLQRCEQILRVQIYTVARNTPESWVTPLANEQLDEIAETVRRLTGLKVQTFYSS